MSLFDTSARDSLSILIFDIKYISSGVLHESKIEQHVIVSTAGSKANKFLGLNL